MRPESVGLTPGIYLEYIEKEYELRVTVIGEKIFAAKISKRQGGAFLDWRFHIDSNQAIVEKFELPDNFKAKIFNVVEEFDLKYGCLDFAVSNGVPYFLEINPTGQFLFIENFVPEMPLLAAFSSFVLSESTSYHVCESNFINLTNFHKSEDYNNMLKLRGSVMWKNNRRSTM